MKMVIVCVVGLASGILGGYLGAGLYLSRFISALAKRLDESRARIDALGKRDEQ